MCKNNQICPAGGLVTGRKKNVMTKKYERRYYDEDNWEHIPEDEVLNKLKENYIDISLVVEELESGETMMLSPFSEIRLKQ